MKKGMTDELLKWILLMMGVIIVIIVLVKITGSLKNPVERLSQSAGEIV